MNNGTKETNFSDILDMSLGDALAALEMDNDMALSVRGFSPQLGEGPGYQSREEIARYWEILAALPKTARPVAAEVAEPMGGASHEWCTDCGGPLSVHTRGPSSCGECS